jgi:hypothetical protein
MEARATYDDVNLILRLYELRREDRMRQAREWFTKGFHARTMQEFEALCPQGSEHNAYFRMVISYWEMVASFITSGVLNQELFFWSGTEMLLVWERVKHLVPAMREMRKNASLWTNLETAASSFIGWFDRGGPEAYQTFAALVGSRR